MGFWSSAPRRAKDGKDQRRVHQLARYMAAHWITPFPVLLRIERIADVHDCVGITYRARSGTHLVIRLDSRQPFDWMASTLMHEWAHAATWPASWAHERRQMLHQHPDHDPAWAAVYGQIEHAFQDGNAWEDSRAW